MVSLPAAATPAGLSLNPTASVGASEPAARRTGGRGSISGPGAPCRAADVAPGAAQVRGWQEADSVAGAVEVSASQAAGGGTRAAAADQEAAQSFAAILQEVSGCQGVLVGVGSAGAVGKGGSDGSAPSEAGGPLEGLGAASEGSEEDGRKPESRRWRTAGTSAWELLLAVEGVVSLPPPGDLSADVAAVPAAPGDELRQDTERISPGARGPAGLPHPDGLRALVAVLDQPTAPFLFVAPHGAPEAAGPDVALELYGDGVGADFAPLLPAKSPEQSPATAGPAGGGAWEPTAELWPAGATSSGPQALGYENSARQGQSEPGPDNPAASLPAEALRAQAGVALLGAPPSPQAGEGHRHTGSQADGERAPADGRREAAVRPGFQAEETAAGRLQSLAADDYRSPAGNVLSGGGSASGAAKQEAATPNAAAGQEVVQAPGESPARPLLVNPPWVLTRERAAGADSAGAVGRLAVESGVSWHPDGGSELASSNALTKTWVPGPSAVPVPRAGEVSPVLRARAQEMAPEGGNPLDTGAPADEAPDASGGRAPAPPGDFSPADGSLAVHTDVETSDEGASATSLGLKGQEPGEAAVEARMTAELRPPAVSPWEHPPDARLRPAGLPSEQPPAELGQRLAHATHRWLQASAPDGLGVRVAQARFDSAAGEFHLQLHPPELGTLRVRVSSHDGALRVVVTADRPDTGWLLVRHSSALEHAFEQAGLRLGSFSVDVGGSPFGGHPQPGGDPLSRLPSPPTFWDMPARMADASGAVDQGGAVGRVWERGSVDLRV